MSKKRCELLGAAEETFWAELRMIDEFEKRAIEALAEKHADRPVLYSELHDVLTKEYSVKRDRARQTYWQNLQHINDGMPT